jgi:aldehyde dehydrogenase (NAD+)
MQNSNPWATDFIARCLQLARDIRAERNTLFSLLCEYETHDTARDEIDRSLDALEGIEAEFEPIKTPLQGLTFATFFPVNLPLYSLVLFGIVPSAFASHVFIRPPEAMSEMLGKLNDLLKIDERFPEIRTKAVPRHVFMSLYVNDADVIIFTGKYENAMAVHQQAPRALLVYNGSGINPFILFEDANLDVAVYKAIEMRCFNSGQDCAGTDAFFVPNSLANSFVAKLEEGLKKVKVGPSGDPDVKVSRTMKGTYLDELAHALEHEQQHIIFGGKIDFAHHYAYPTIVRKYLAEHKGEFHEFFAPVFYILEYASLEELEHILLSTTFTEKTMYISIFGNNPELEKKLSYATVLKEKIVNDVEQGNHEYGGWGSKANFLLYGDQKIVRPILISRDIHQMLQN